MECDLVFLDWDGTTADTRKLAYGAACETFRSYDVTPPSFQIFMREIASDFVRFYHRHGIPEKATRDDINRVFRNYYYRNVAQTKLRDGALELLQYIRRKKKLIALVTGLSGHCTGVALRHTGLSGFFDVVRANANGKEKEFRAVLAELSVKPRRAIAVGDVVEDVRAAKAVGIFAAAIAGGFGTEEDLRREGPDIFLPNLQEFKQKISLR